MEAISTSLAAHGSRLRRNPSLSLNSYFPRSGKKFLAPSSPSPAESHLWVATLGKASSQHRLRASPGEVPSGVTEDSKFVPLNAEDPMYGPPAILFFLHSHVGPNPQVLVHAIGKIPLQALLLVGFEANETAKICQLLKDLDGEFLKVIHCTEDMTSLTVWDAIHVQQPKVEALKKVESLPRICMLSGLSGEEMMMFIDAFPETGLEPAVFSAMVPNSANKLLGEVIEEIMGDHEMMSAKQ